MSLPPIAVVPTQANRIRAARKANSSLSAEELAREMGLSKRIVNVALSKGDDRRIKSVAK